MLFVLLLFILVIKNAAVALIVPMAKRPNSLFCASTTLDFVRLSFVRRGAVLPPYKKLALLTKNRSVSLHFQKPMQRVGYSLSKTYAACGLFVVIDVILALDHNKEVLLMHLLAPL